MRAYKLNVKEFIVKYFDSTTKMEGLKINKNLQYIIDCTKSELDDKKELKHIDKELQPYNFDVWRDQIYYAWIRNKINYQNIGPNFISSYCYFINKDADISFEKNGMLLNELKDKSFKELLYKEFTNCIMLLLTESPNQNIFQWASNAYTKDRGIHKMVHSGFKPDTHWKSVIAQILIIFYIMDKYCFTIREMQIQSNFYIKDLNIFGDVKQYWQYTIANIDYYIPNFGHLVMLDHNYKELTNPDNKGKNRIMMKEEFGDGEEQIQQTIISNAIECFNPANFGSVFTSAGGVGLSEKIIGLLNEIYSDLVEHKHKNETSSTKKKTSEFWNETICKYMMKLEYIHNRVGTPLRDLEYPYIRKNETRPRPFKIGELVIYEEKFETYKIYLLIKNNAEDTCSCITKNESNKYEIKPISKDLLLHYSELETIKQDGKMGEPVIGFEHILERYII